MVMAANDGIMTMFLLKKHRKKSPQHGGLKILADEKAGQW